MGHPEPSETWSPPCLCVPGGTAPVSWRRPDPAFPFLGHRANPARSHRDCEILVLAGGDGWPIEPSPGQAGAVLAPQAAAPGGEGCPSEPLMPMDRSIYFVAKAPSSPAVKFWSIFSSRTGFHTLKDKYELKLSKTTHSNHIKMKVSLLSYVKIILM